MFRRTVLVVVVFLLALVTALGGYAALHWQPDRTVAALKSRWAKPPSDFIDIAGQLVHVRDEGPRNSSTVIVLLHGTGASLHTWDGWAQPLSSSRRVVRFDLPGFGLTGPATTRDYSIDAYVRFLVAALDTLGIERCILVGNSLGGHVAWVTALKHPERVAALALVDANGYGLSRRIRYRWDSGWRKTDLLGPLVRNVLPRSLIVRSLETSFGDPARVSPGLVDRYFELSTRVGNRDALVDRMAQLTSAYLRERIPEVEQPTLIIWGGLDRLIPVEAAHRFDTDLPHSELVIFEDLGHVPQEEDPERTVAAFIEFVKRLDPATP